MTRHARPNKQARLASFESDDKKGGQGAKGWGPFILTSGPLTRLNHTPRPLYHDTHIAGLPILGDSSASQSTSEGVGLAALAASAATRASAAAASVAAAFLAAMATRFFSRGDTASALAATRASAAAAHSRWNGCVGVKECWGAIMALDR